MSKSMLPICAGFELKAKKPLWKTFVSSPSTASAGKK
jgi:hypothetical protein